MLHKAGSLKTDITEHMRGGKGALKSTLILQKDDFCGKGRLFNHCVLEPGCSVGVHEHTGDFEVYYFLKGNALYTDDDSTYAVGPGDVTVCPSGHKHGVENTSDEDLEFIALILFSD